MTNASAVSTRGAASTEPTVGTKPAADPQARRADLVSMAAGSGIRLQTSRRDTDECSGPTLFWMFETSSGALVSPADGCTDSEVVTRLRTGWAPAVPRRWATGVIPAQAARA